MTRFGWKLFTWSAAWLLFTTATASAQQVLVADFFGSAIRQYKLSDGSHQFTITDAALSGPSGMVVGADNNLYISSQSNNSILKYDFTTSTMSTFIDSSVLTGIAANYNPAGLVFGSDGNLYVARNGGSFDFSGTGAVDRFLINGDGTFDSYDTTVLTGLFQPTSLALDSSDNLYVSNFAALGASPTPDGKQVYKVADYTSGTPSPSTFVASFSTAMVTPAGLTFDSTGKLLVADLNGFTPPPSSQGNVFRFDTAGNPDGSTGTPADGIWATPNSNLIDRFASGLWVDDTDRVYVATLGDTGSNGNVLWFNADGTFDSVFIASGTGGLLSASQIILSPVPEPAQWCWWVRRRWAWAVGFVAAGKMRFEKGESFAHHGLPMARPARS